MKTRNYIIAIASLILVSMIWFSCEKEEILPINTVTETIDMPAEVAAYLTENEINEFNQEVETVKKAIPPLYTVKIVGIVMDNEIEYLYQKDPEFQSPTQIIFTGRGVWKGFGRIRYSETVNLYKKPIGEGIIFLVKPRKDKIGPITETPLEFESSLRQKGGFVTENPTKGTDSENTKFYEERFYSRINFTGGDGIFYGAYGIAHKVEIHYADRPNYCKAVIYGYVVIKAPDV
jgi:hypothetical protein